MKYGFKLFQRIILMLLIISAAQQTHATGELSLDGQWEIVFDHDNTGRQSGWFNDAVFSKLETRRNIQVPSAWELVEMDYEGVAFYRREFEVPKNWQGKVVRMQCLLFFTPFLYSKSLYKMTFQY